MKRRITLLLAALMTLLSCAENEFEYDNPLDRRGTDYKGDLVTAFTDSRDNKTYWKVTIGTRTWMAENLNYNASGSKCYGNSNANCEKYGRLYSWETARTACPAGWHLPSVAEWTMLETSVGGSLTAGAKLKSKTGWNDNGNGTDDYGFSALPGGYGNSVSDHFINTGNYGYWWSATADGTNYARLRIMSYFNETVSSLSYYKENLHSVRCVQDAGTYTITFDANGGSGTSPDAQTVNAGFTVTLPNQGDLTRSNYAFGGWNTSTDGTGTNYTGSYTPSATITLYARWNTVSVGVPPTPTVTKFTDKRDGKTYNMVTIGTQTWMAENLNYDVPVITSDVCYDNDTSNCAKYGRWYDWATAMDINASYNSYYWNGSDVNHQGVCPEGWHLPSDAEWTVLTDYVGGASTAGTKLKSTSGWDDFNGKSGNGTDPYGFSALPGGSGDGRYGGAGYSGFWWSATADNDNADSAWNRYMEFGDESVYRYNHDKSILSSVRCVADQ